MLSILAYICLFCIIGDRCVDLDKRLDSSLLLHVFTWSNLWTYYLVSTGRHVYSLGHEIFHVFPVQV